MAIVEPQPIADLPTPPDPNDRTTFNQRAYLWSAALNPWTGQANALGAATNANALSAHADALSAHDDALAAGTSASNAHESEQAAGGHALVAASAQSQAAASATTATSQAAIAVSRAAEATAAAAGAQAIVLGVSTGHPKVRPSLDLPFASTRIQDPRITFTRASEASYFDSKGVLRWAPANEMRFTFDPATGESLGYLAEPQRTNSCLWSEYFSNGWWVKAGGTIDAGPTLRGFSFQKFVESATTEDHSVRQSISIATGVSNALSMYLLAAGRSRARIAGLISSSWSTFPAAVVNLTTGTIESSAGDKPATIESIGDGIYRVTIYGTTSSTSAGILVHPLPATGGASSYAGDGTSGIYISGAQVEVGASPTSYIRTAAAQVTRAADNALIDGIAFTDFYNQGEGTVLVEAVSRGYESITTVLGASSTNRLQVSIASNAAPDYYSVVDGNVSINRVGAPLGALPVTLRGALAYTATTIRAASNGVSHGLGAGNVHQSMQKLSVGTSSGLTNGTISRLAYYPKALTDAELQAITAP